MILFLNIAFSYPPTIGAATAKKWFKLKPSGQQGFTALGTLEMARLKGYVTHATKMHFWAQRIFQTPVEPRRTWGAFEKDRRYTETKAISTCHCNILQVVDHTISPSQRDPNMSRLHQFQAKITDTRSFLDANVALLPKLEEEQQALIHQAYGEKIDSETTWAAGQTRLWPPWNRWLHVLQI